MASLRSAKRRARGNLTIGHTVDQVGQPVETTGTLNETCKRKQESRDQLSLEHLIKARPQENDCIDFSGYTQTLIEFDRQKYSLRISGQMDNPGSESRLALESRLKLARLSLSDKEWLQDLVSMLVFRVRIAVCKETSKKIHGWWELYEAIDRESSSEEGERPIVTDAFHKILTDHGMTRVGMEFLYGMVVGVFPTPDCKSYRELFGPDHISGTIDMDTRGDAILEGSCAYLKFRSRPVPILQNDWSEALPASSESGSKVFI